MNQENEPAPQASKPTPIERRLQSVKERPPFRVWDIAVYIVLAAAIIGVILAVFLPSARISESAKIRITVNGELYAEVAFSDGETAVTVDGETLLVLVVRDGVATVKDSVCGDHLCEKMRIDGRHHQIICLPGGVVLILDDSFAGQEILPGGAS